MLLYRLGGVLSVALLLVSTPLRAACPTAFEQEVVLLVNQERATSQISPLALDDRLLAAAQGHALDMATNNFMSHTGSDGSSARDRIVAAGYTGPSWGENVAGGFFTPAAVVSAWMNSSGHRANILNPNFDHIGVGWAYRAGTTYGNYQAQSFGGGTTLVAACGSSPECSDGIDNDGDGFTDFDGGDSGCTDPDDSSENDPTLPCDDGIDNDSDGSIDFPTDPDCDDLLDSFEAPDPMQPEVKLKIRLKFNKPSKDKIQLKIKDWQLPAGVVPTDVSVNVGGVECTGTLDAAGKFKSPDGRDSITMKQSKKTQFWSLAVKRKNNDFAADLWDEGCTDADNPKPGLPVTVPVIINVGGVAYEQDVDLVYESKLGKRGTAK